MEVEVCRLEVNQVRQMAQLQKENQRLKRFVADLTLDKTMLRTCSQKVVKPSERGLMVEHLERLYCVGERGACRVLRANL